MGKKEKTCKVSIGGQAVLEGVMMRGKTAMATAVRDSDGIIRLETKRIKPLGSNNLFFRLPIIRGVVNFLSSMFGGTAVLMRSADVFGEGEPSKLEKWFAEKLKVNVMSVVSIFSLVLGLALAIGLFIFLPQLIRVGLQKLFNNGLEFNVWATNFIEGGVKLIIFVSYILLVSLLKDIKRTFMYHGAEHKTITCYEKGLELTVENARKCKRVHDRCGTTFLVFVMLVSIILFALFESLLYQYQIELSKGIRILCKIGFLPIVAGLSYELLKGLSKTDCFIFFPLKVPGLLLQRITTREPSDDMLEVAITAFSKVLEMDSDQSIKEQTFVLPLKREELTKNVIEKLKENGIEERAEAEWIVSITLGVKRDEVYLTNLVTPKYVEKVNAVVEERITGKPLWYCIGDTDFYGYKIKVDNRVLIPRPETEELVLRAKEYITDKSQVLDMCTGSGAIAIAIKKETNAMVTAVDISSGALELAKENAKLNGADIEFIESDMFTSLEGRKFDVIISNPPYIKTKDLSGLQKEVKEFEPMLALDGGEDGLTFYKIIAEKVEKHLNENGVLLMEIGYNQSEEVMGLFSGYKEISAIKDLENKDRIIKVVF
ncbi:MAG: peptide chain release factor N(5)-glutamine methyltransferase [Clostridia bacterium]|nr:peptide chain release factor N(5)-glutamine methyltransferase [Clostridia bacterium]